MSYLVLARKYRPQDFTSVTGQEHVTRTLSNAIKRDKVSHAHLFCGPRGVGKTSIARVFSKALNCSKGPTPNPCLECTNCKEIAAGTSLAVREIDGASHNSVDNVRDLIDSFRALPPPGSRYKIYIIDEVHMLSVAAFNALLKSLEEPPPNTVFILATTEVHKIPETVISRCVRHDFRALGPAEIEARLTHVAKAEKLDIEPEVLRMITRISDGSMRDSQSLLDRVQSFCEGTITASEASRILGTVERALLAGLVQSTIAREPGRVLEVLSQVFERGVDPTIFLREFVTFWRELLVGKVGGTAALAQLGLAAQERSDLLALAQGVSLPDLQDLVQVARQGADAALRSAYGKYAIEALLVRLASREPVMELARVLEQVAQLGGNARPSAAPARTAPAPQTSTLLSAPKIQPMQSPAPAAAPLEWSSFVAFATEHGARMLAEHLRRLSTIRFEPGVLEARGPKFNVSSLEGKENLERLKKALTDYTKTPAWRVVLTAAEQGELAGSLVQTERAQVAEKRKKTEEAINNHPKIKSLQRVFPGSSIEDIKVKD
ncbi:MAG: DNA polymerase III subunit gamma/tau [Proteobacteria bacterium]|nr:DNA polymerase III subunit gamma/tau [Pseudomonadota bacterium]